MQQAHDDGRSEHHTDHWKHILVPSQLGVDRQDRPVAVVPAAMAVFVFRPLRPELSSAVGAMGPPGAAAPRPEALVADPVVDVLRWELAATVFAPDHATSIPSLGARNPAWGTRRQAVRPAQALMTVARPLPLCYNVEWENARRPGQVQGALIAARRKGPKPY